MAWYRSGTLSVTNGSTSVTGAGTSWIAGAGIGEALYAPDGRIYEIANISSNTSLTLATAYLGTTQSAQSYTIIPSQSYIRDLAADAAALISQYAGIASGAGAGKFTDGTVSTPGIAFASDVDTGIYHPATNTLGIAAGGINQMQVGTAGVNIGTLSANPVISAGTANGVTYLNASKQLTSGSALTFDGTNFKNAGAVVSGASGSAGTFTLNRSSDGNGIAVFESLAGTNDVGLRNAQGSILFSATGTEQMRLTSTGLGIGTSSPAYKLDVAGGGARMLRQTSGGVATTGTSGNFFAVGRWTIAQYAHAQRLQLRVLGSAGYGPNQTGETIINCVIDNTNTISGYFYGTTYGTRDTVTDVVFKYNTDGYDFWIKSGQFASVAVIPDATEGHWVPAYGDTGSASQPSGSTALGTLFAVTTGGYERARIDSAGNLGLGVTPSVTNSNLKALQVNQATFANNASSTILASNAYYDPSYTPRYLLTGVPAASQVFNPTGSGGLSWFTAPSGTAGQPISFTQAMTLDASGKLLVGTTSASTPAIAVFNRSNALSSTILVWTNSTNNSGYLHVLANGAGITADGHLSLGSGESGTNGFTERARIDSSGNLLVGSAASSGAPANGIQLNQSTSASYVTIGHLNGTASGNWYINFAYNASAIGSITQNGTTAVAYNTSSDYRLKNITGPVQNSGSYIDSLNPVEGTWKADGSTFVGLIAHEVQEASRTQVATGEKDGEQMQSMDYSNSELIANLIAEVKSLRARVAALETN